MQVDEVSCHDQVNPLLILTFSVVCAHGSGELQEKYYVFDLAYSIQPVNWVRLTLVYCHLLASAFAIVLVLTADWRILKGSYTLEALQLTANHASVVLLVLWVTGLTLVYSDTGMNFTELAAKPKLVLKLFVVGALTINGVILHVVSFPLFAKTGRLRWSESVVLALTGAISTSHWVLAAFVGVARPLGQWPIQSLLLGYTLYVIATVSLAIICVPMVHRHLSNQRQRLQSSREPSTMSQVDIFLPLSNQP